MHNGPTQHRLYKYDTIRFILIFLVIVGHCMELFHKGWVRDVYRVIYSFHIPAFIFITGMFAEFDRHRIVKHLILPYLIFQPVYQHFHAYLFEKTVTFQYTTPYWILWYLLTIIFFYMLIPMLPEKKSPWVIPVLIGSFLVALHAGTMKNIGYYMSLSRFICLFPFFIWGYYYDSIVGRKRENAVFRVSVGLLSLIVILLAEYYLYTHAVPKAALYLSKSYISSKSLLIDRVIILATAFSWILLLECLIPNRKIPVISTLGQNTIAIFLLHGFIIRIAAKTKFFHYSLQKNMLLAIGIAAAIIVVLGNPVVSKWTRKVM